MNDSVFGKTMENVRKHRDIKLVITHKKTNQLVSEPNYHTSKCFSENLMAIEMNNILACQYQILAKHLCLNFGMTALNRSMDMQSKTMLHRY